MILIHITSTSQEQIHEIVDWLSEEKLILHPIILEKVVLRSKNENGSFINEKQFLVMAKARALMFGKIEYLMKKKFKEEMPDLYSLPIVNMDWQKAELLKKPKSKKKPRLNKY